MNLDNKIKMIEKENVIMERIFTNALKKQLKQRIKGDLSVHIVDDTIIVDIQSLGCYTWHYIINNLSAQISTGLSSRIVADAIVKQYRNFILSKHFYSK
jgi:hypothetical protein